MAVFAASAGIGDAVGEEKPVRLPPISREATPTPAPRRLTAGVNPATPVPNPAEVAHSKAGPWGELDYFTIYLEASTSMLKAMDFPTYESEWNFVDQTDEQLKKFFLSLNLPEPLQTALLDIGKWRHTDKVTTLMPTEGMILGLPPEARAAIYRTLAQWEENPFHHEPEVVAGGDVREWLSRANLPEEVVSTIEKTTYKRGRNTVFADTPLVLRMVSTEEDRLKIRKALSRTPSLSVSLRLTPDTDLAKITEYWGGPKRFKDITPFLESVANNPAASSIDIVHVLPATARRLLYTYPGTSSGKTGYFPDCHWTSLNFRNYEPLDRLADPTMATAYVLENYARATGPYKYADVLFFMDGNTGNAIHSCVYLADDIVFTKNGRSPMQPWVLMKLDDVLAYYSMYYTPQVACYRFKGE